MGISSHLCEGETPRTEPLFRAGKGGSLLVELLFQFPEFSVADELALVSGNRRRGGDVLVALMKKCCALLDADGTKLKDFPGFKARRSYTDGRDIRRSGLLRMFQFMVLEVDCDIGI